MEVTEEKDVRELRAAGKRRATGHELGRRIWQYLALRKESAHHQNFPLQIVGVGVIVNFMWQLG